MSGRERRGTQLGVGESRVGRTLALGVGWPGSSALLFFFPVVLDGAQRASRPSRTPTPARSCSSTRRSIATATSPSRPRGLLSFREAFTNSLGGRARLDAPSSCSLWRSRPPTPSPIRPVAEVARRAVLLHLDEVPAGRRVDPADLWILARNFDLLNTRLVLIILYTAINLPLAIWMLRSFFREIPRELIEAAEIDGAGLRGPARLGDPADRRARHRRDRAALRDLRLERVLLRRPAQLRSTASTMPIWVTTNISTRGNFLAKLSAASVLACLPVVLAGWLAQKRMIRGLSMGAIK